MEKSGKNIWLELANDLENLLESKVQTEAIKERYSGQEPDEEFRQVMCYLEHYFSDSDIREQDSRYKEVQNKEMSKLIRLIRSGNYKKASMVSFLNESQV